MKTASFNEYGDSSVIEIREIQRPLPNKDEILVKVQAAALNPKDVLIRKGKFKRFSGKKFPQGIGFDFAGIIANTNQIQPFLKDQKVYGMINGWKGKCCAEYVTVPVSEVYSMPENISFAEAASLPLVNQTALQALRNLGKVTSGSKVFIHGASGGVGTAAIQIARALGATVTTTSSPTNFDLCKELGADVTLDYNEQDAFHPSQTYDVFFDVFGNRSFPICESLLTDRGIYVTTVPKATIFREQFKNYFRKKKARLVFVKSNKEDLEWLHQKVKDKSIRPVVDQTFPFDQVRQAQEYIETKRARGKVVITLD